MIKAAGKTVSLVLGGGGARGMAHIGVIRWLLENDYQIKSIAGTSMGALIGGVYAAGKLGEYEQWLRAITKVNIVTLLDISWSGGGLFRGDKIINNLISLVGEQQIEDLPITYTAVATDLQAQKEIWIKSGNLFNAIRASIAIPLFFTPFRHKGVDLVDGGILNPVPIAPTFGDGTDMTIAVNLGGPPLRPVEQRVAGCDPEPASRLPATINRFINYARPAGPNNNRSEKGSYDVVLQSFEAMQSTIARQKLAAYPPDKVVEIARDACRTLEFYRAAEMIDLGYQKARESLS